MRALSSVLLAGAVLTGCEIDEADRVHDTRFPLAPHDLMWTSTSADGQIAAGRATGRALEQPIGFSHKLHTGELAIDCEFCHNEARRSLHAGVPPVQTCMNCHQFIRTDSPEVQKIHQAYCGEPKCAVGRDAFGQPVQPTGGQPIPWNKVHDLPDYVHFAHNRHVLAGVQCTECHGQVQLQGEYTVVDQGGVSVRQVDSVMVREASLQMGWCLGCHQHHPSIDENYGDKSDLRRSELKDCWTCHK